MLFREQQDTNMIWTTHRFVLQEQESGRTIIRLGVEIFQARRSSTWRGILLRITQAGEQGAETYRDLFSDLVLERKWSKENTWDTRPVLLATMDQNMAPFGEVQKYLCVEGGREV
jgi:hypothetical protein